MKKRVLIAVTILLVPLLAIASTFVDGHQSFWPIESNNAIPVNVQDQASEVIDLHLMRTITDITITSNTSIDDTIVSIDSDVTPQIGNSVCFKESTAFYQGDILSVTPTGGTGYDIELDMPLDYAYTTDGGCALRDKNLNVDGSTTPVVFSVSPQGLIDPLKYNRGQRWDIVRLMLAITDATAMDDGKFGGITGGITNGIVIRKKNGTYKNIFNAKTNGDIALHVYDLTYIDDTLGPAGLYGLRVRRTFGGQNKNGVVIRLDADDDDEFQVIVRDNLTGLDGFTAVVQGHIAID